MLRPFELEDKGAVTQKAAGGRKRQVTWLYNIRFIEASIIPYKSHHHSQEKTTDILLAMGDSS